MNRDGFSLVPRTSREFPEQFATLPRAASSAQTANGNHTTIPHEPAKRSRDHEINENEDEKKQQKKMKQRTLRHAGRAVADPLYERYSAHKTKNELTVGCLMDVAGGSLWSNRCGAIKEDSYVRTGRRVAHDGGPPRTAIDLASSLLCLLCPSWPAPWSLVQGDS